MRVPKKDKKIKVKPVKEKAVRMKVINENPKKVPGTSLDPGFKYVEVEFTEKKGKITKDIVALHAIQIAQCK